MRENRRSKYQRERTTKLVHYILVCLILFYLFSTSVFAVCPSGAGNVCSKASGNWNDPAIWDIDCDGNTSNDGSVPSPGSNVCISVAHNVTLNTNTSISNLQVDGTLNLGTTNNILTITGNVTINGTWNPGNGKVVWLSANNIVDPVADPAAADYYDLEIQGASTYTVNSTIRIVNSLFLNSSTTNSLTIENGGKIIVGNNGAGGIYISANNTLNCATAFTVQPIIEFAGG
ncbi:MAG: hypothetical protein ACK4NF_02165, partial [Planctomycetota bacterium]